VIVQENKPKATHPISIEMFFISRNKIIISPLDGEPPLTYIKLTNILTPITMELLAKLSPKHPLSALPGIGRHTPRALAKYGIQTIGQFACFTETEIMSLLGGSGVRLLTSARTIAR